MDAATRKIYNALCARFAKTYKVDNVGVQFAVEPRIAQNLRDKIVEHSTFLPKINFIGVKELKGQNVYGSASRPVTSRTDTSQAGKEREAINVLGLEPGDYECFKVNSDVALPYETMDSWAFFEDLPERYQRYVLARIANDKEIIGWYGIKAEATSSFDTSPLMQDVNRGWMQYMREVKPGNILTEGATPGELRIGAGGDYANLDLAVNDLLHAIPSYMRNGLVALVGSDLIAQEKSALFGAVSMTPTEKVLYGPAMSTLGGLPWETPSNFPDRGLVVTSYDNLSIYQQNGSHRRQIIDNPKKDRIEDFNSVNEGYTVEEAEKFVAVEFANVKVPDGAGGWA